MPFKGKQRFRKDGLEQTAWGMWRCAAPGRGWLTWHSLRKNKRVSVYMFRRLNCHPWQFTLALQYFIAMSSGIHKTIGPNLLIPVFWSFMATQRMDKILAVQAEKSFTEAFFPWSKHYTWNLEKQKNKPFPHGGKTQLLLKSQNLGYF